MLPHLLPPGSYSYPFQHQLRPDLPGCAYYHTERSASDPEWKKVNRLLKVHAEVTYKIKAYVDFNGLFVRDLFS